MNKIGVYFSIVLLTIVTILGCSKDDSIDNLNKKELLLTANKRSVVVGDVVTFSALDKSNNEVSDAVFYINQQKITKTYKFDKKGVYNVIAKKVGYQNSTVFSVFVSDSGEAIVEPLKLDVDKQIINIGDKVQFSVTTEGGKDIKDYKIQEVGGTVLSSNIWTAEKAGKYKFIATKADYANSNVIEVVVKPNSIVEAQTFVINGVKYNIKEVVLAVDVNESTKKAILYTEGNSAYFVFKLFAEYSNSTFAMTVMKVLVPSDTQKIVYPYEVESSKVISIGGVGVVDGQLLAEVDAEDIEKTKVKWISPLVDRKGMVEYDFSSKDRNLEIIYKGIYSGLSGVPVKQNNANLKVENRNTGYVDDRLK
ncbi:hypothetical protein LNQ81_03430 [Myroides sp. M-43]|uniref:hypothetical protein n=1 Tax=Myroides oncorhynchi TaxID=2893756 RepID=UPI001E2AC9E1|nr:hypothetical protein [Myroides oncorhynchi]MCC9041753.1 hypothetical protein [Myroides oncorhynchi]